MNLNSTQFDSFPTLQIVTFLFKARDIRQHLFVKWGGIQVESLGSLFFLPIFFMYSNTCTHLAHPFFYPLQGSKSSFEFNFKFERELKRVTKDKAHHEAKEAQKQTHRGSPYSEI